MTLVVKLKNNYILLRKIHYLEKKRNLLKLNLINDEYDDWRSEITKWFNKWATDGYYINSTFFYINNTFFCTKKIKQNFKNLLNK